MPRKPDGRSLEDVVSALEELLGVRAVRRLSQAPLGGLQADLLLQIAGVTFAVEWKAVGDAAQVGSGLRQLQALRKAIPGQRAVVPLLAVPFMGETGRRLCEEASISWLDLSGNAWIDAPGRQIRILGHKNRFAARGRPADVFATRSSRVVRALLMERPRAFTQPELVASTGVDKGRVSRLVSRLAAMDLVERAGRAIRVKDPDVMLDAWRESYDFEQHDIRRGHVAVRSPEELIQRIGRMARPAGVDWAITGLAGAWQLTHFAAFRLTTVFVRQFPPTGWQEELGFQDEPRGANLWLVRPIDDAVFQGAKKAGGIPCAHPLQVYLDLKAHPERAEEAAQEVRRRLLGGKRY